MASSYPWHEVENNTIPLAQNPLYRPASESFYSTNSPSNGNGDLYDWTPESQQHTIYGSLYSSSETEQQYESAQGSYGLPLISGVESQYIVPIDPIETSLYDVPLDYAASSVQGAHGPPTSFQETAFGSGEGYGEVYVSANLVRSCVASFVRGDKRRERERERERQTDRERDRERERKRLFICVCIVWSRLLCAGRA